MIMQNVETQFVPTGLISEIANFLDQSPLSPSSEVAIMAAIELLLAASGHVYQVPIGGMNALVRPFGRMGFFGSIDVQSCVDTFLFQLVSEPSCDSGHSIPSVIKIFREFHHGCLKLSAHNKFIDVKISSNARAYFCHMNPGYLSDFPSFDTKTADDKLLIRTNILILRIASVAAISRDHANPVVGIADAEWGNAFVKCSLPAAVPIVEKSNLHEKQTNMELQKAVIARAAMQFIGQQFESVEQYGVRKELHINRIIPYTYFQRKLVANAVFRHDKEASTVALKRAIRIMLEEGALIEVEAVTLTKYGFNGQAFMHGDMNCYAKI